MKKIMACAMALQIAILFLLPVCAKATYVEHEGLEITVEMDKKQYEAGEPITATITVKNTNATVVIISNLEQLIPEGYHLAENSKAGMKDIELRPQQTMVLEVTFEGDPAEEQPMTEQFFDKLLNGETFGIPNLLLAVIFVIAFVIFMILT